VLVEIATLNYCLCLMSYHNMTYGTLHKLGKFYSQVEIVVLIIVCICSLR
jgi:hypothetical protein